MAYVILEEKLYDEAFLTDYAAFKVGKGENADLEAYRTFLKDYTPEKAAALCGGNITAAAIRTCARWFAKSSGTLSAWCMGINQRQQGVWANNLIHNLHILTGQLCKPGADSFSLTGQPNACGGVREAGGLCHILPGHRPVVKDKLRHQVEDAWGVPRGRIPAKPGLHTMAMFEAVNDGRIKAIWINCTSPAQSLPNATPYQKGMAREDVFIIASDIFPTRTTEYANLILPAAFHFEKTGVYGCTERRSQLTPRAVQAPGQAMPEVWMVREWALKLAAKLDDPVIARCVEPFVGLEENAALPEAIWNEYTHKLTKGRDNDLRGASYQVLGQMPDGVQWPAPTEAFALTGGTTMKFVRGLDPLADEHGKGDKPFVFYGPAHGDGKLWIWLRHYVGAAEEPDAEYPVYLSNGRVVDHWHTTSMTGRIPELMRANPYAYIEVNPRDAGRMGIGPGDMVEVQSRRGSAVFPAKIVEGPMEGVVFVYWHDMHAERMINLVTKDAYDPGSKEPEFKISACRIKKVSGPRALKPFIVTL